ncbi:protein-glutamine gamma-glutamyltransferase E-like [Spea bombifrons]|uniref:protein-glutamine gamma-glutamyltransferase E-like n=1 Tax=Spea bombifrons TaxID=233779 RepID=UPI0023494A8F|nr:protein-glutamine gamma-glutamyltransferase E-like [Spea bombifrons]
MAGLQVISCDWHLSANKKAHHTNVFDSTDLILRRGQPFVITLNFSRAPEPGENIQFTCETGPSPSEETKTKVSFPLFRAQETETWSAVLTSSSAKSLTVTINSPSNSVIGRYILSVSVLSNRSDQGAPQKIGGLYLIFNPWVQEDDVFLSEEDERQEYVLNEYGVIFVGSYDDITSRNWEYNQFDANILDICFAILDHSINYQKDPASDVSQRSDPLYVCRVLNATVNSKDENGVLVENWSGDYDDGVSPTSWNGSTPILKQWYYKGFRPVKYGQCWVYGGVLCTVLRCLGIPNRVITNFNSAQDKNGNLCIDLYYDSHASSQQAEQDLIWNFHVWNEAWFRRSDIGAPYNGWQVMDSTPLETSKGIYRCGPAPLHAIKEGDTDLNYDVGFMFASVNADVASWIQYSDGTKKRTTNDTRAIGKYISTKAVGTDDRVDVTHTYKHSEGSKEEREVFEKAVHKLHEGPIEELERNLLGLRRRGGDRTMQGEILFGRFKVEKVPTVGQDIEVMLTLKNLKADTISIVVNMTASCILYTGRPKHEIWTEAKSVQLGPQQEINISIPLTYTQYGKCVKEDNVIRMTALCEVEGSEERILVEKDVTLVKLPLSMKMPTQAVIYTTFYAEVELSNTFSETLNSCVLTLEGSGLVSGQFQHKLPPLKPGKKYTTHFIVTPFKSGLRTLQLTFNSDKIQNVKASQKVMVIGSH